MGQKRGRVEGSFVRETREQAVMFYRDLVQNLKAWQVRPPQIRTEAAIADGSDPPSAPISCRSHLRTICCRLLLTATCRTMMRLAGLCPSLRRRVRFKVPFKVLF
jgi:hypothetical protein